ncbi:hypothetical protein FB45DRAFT_914612, partial [Roridomyces roridus]
MAGFDMGAQSIICSSMFSEIPQLLESSNAEIRLETARLMTALTSHDLSSEAIDATVRFPDSANSDKDTVLVEEALNSLIQIALWLPGAEAIVASDALEYTQELVASTNPELGIRAAVLASTIACHSELEATIASTIEKIDPFGRIAFLLRHNDSKDTVIRKGLFGLCRMARSISGAQRIMETPVLDYVVAKRSAFPAWLQIDSCRFIAELSSHETVLSKVLAANSVSKLLQILREWLVADEALAALCQISNWKLGAKAIFDTPGALDTITKMEWGNST